MSDIYRKIDRKIARFIGWSVDRSGYVLMHDMSNDTWSWRPIEDFHDWLLSSDGMRAMMEAYIREFGGSVYPDNNHFVSFMWGIYKAVRSGTDINTAVYEAVKQYLEVK